MNLPAIPRRPYKDGVELSILGFGGIIICGLTLEQGKLYVAEAYDRGINYFDVAPSYYDGEAELKLGEALKPYRSKVFLACKTGRRDAAAAREELERSLQRAHSDYFDLYQFHGVTTREDVRQILAPGGAAETLVKAKREGLARFIGASCHTVEAALALLEALDLDSLLLPINYVAMSYGDFGGQVIEQARRKGVARLALKAMAHTRLAEGEPRSYPKAWYRPLDDFELGRLALYFTLDQDITAAVPPGDHGLYKRALDYASVYRPLKPAERERLLEAGRGVTPLFTHPAWTD